VWARLRRRFDGRAYRWPDLSLRLARLMDEIDLMTEALTGKRRHFFLKATLGPDHLNQEDPSRTAMTRNGSAASPKAALSPNR
jgi:hypothetical protein